MIAGAVPLTRKTQVRSQRHAQIGRTIIGGLTVGAPRALYVVPATYTLLSWRVRPVLPTLPLDEEAHPMLHGPVKRRDGASPARQDVPSAGAIAMRRRLPPKGLLTSSARQFGAVSSIMSDAQVLLAPEIRDPALRLRGMAVTVTGNADRALSRHD